MTFSESWQKCGVLKLYPAFSREVPSKRVYVHHIMTQPEQSKSIYQLMQVSSSNMQIATIKRNIGEARFRPMPMDDYTSSIHFPNTCIFLITVDS